MTMPANLEAERSILGAILLEPKHYYQAAALLPQTFSLKANADIWVAIQDLHAASRPLDFITLTEELAKHEKLETAGGAAYLSSLIDGVPERPSIESYVAIVRDKAHRRWLIEQCELAAAQLADGAQETTDCMAVMESAALRVRADAGSGLASFAPTGSAVITSSLQAQRLKGISSLRAGG